MSMRCNHFAPANLKEAAYVMDDVLKISTDTKLAEPNEKGSTCISQPFEIMERVAGFEPVTPTLARLCSTS